MAEIAHGRIEDQKAHIASLQDQVRHLETRNRALEQQMQQMMQQMLQQGENGMPQTQMQRQFQQLQIGGSENVWNGEQQSS